MNPDRLRKAPNLAIIGSTSPLGKELKEMIETSSFPAGKVSLLETEEYAGLLQEFAGEIQITQILSPELFSDVDIAFLTCSPEIISGYAATGNAFPDLAIDLTQTRNEGTLFLSGVSKPTVLPARGSIISPHPAAISICRVLSRLQSSFKLASAAVTIFQPASERGSSGVDELQEQTVSLLNFQQVESRTYRGQLAFNILPEVEASRKMEVMLRRQIEDILGAQTPIPAVAVIHAPVFHSHCFSMFLRFSETPTAAEIEACLRDSRGTIAVHRNGDIEASPVTVVGTETVHVGRIEVDSASGQCFLWLVSDNLRIAAHNALQIAESIILAPAL